MNGPFTHRVQDCLYVEVFKPIQLESIDPPDPSQKPRKPLELERGEHVFLIVKLGENGTEEWAVLSKDPRFGKRMKHMRGLEKAGSVEVAHRNGKAYFNG
ncbi:MAG: hypothetical protein Q7R54_00285 [bacterium]|nr:hypothetical protein [bacterium]